MENIEVRLSPMASAPDPLPPAQPSMVMPAPISADQQSKFDTLDKMFVGINKDLNRSVGGRVKDVYGDTSGLEFISTGILSVDAILGGGVARGKLYEVYGPEGSGKTSLVLQTTAQAQKMALIAGDIDAEFAFDAPRSVQLGVDIDQLYLVQPDYGEQAIDIAADMCKSGVVGLLFIDSVAALVPKSELEGSIEDSHQMALAASMMSKAMRRLKVAASVGGTAVIFINQLREKPGVVFGNPEYTPGGRAIKFFADVRVEVRRKALIKAGEEVIGQSVAVKAVKNKLAPPHVTAMANLYYDGRGFDSLDSVLETALMQGVLNKSGSWFNVPLDTQFFPELAGKNIGQGPTNARQFLLDDKTGFKDKLISVCTTRILDHRKDVLQRLSHQIVVGSIHSDTVPIIEEKRKPAAKKK